MLRSTTLAVLLSLPLQFAVATDVFAHFMVQNAYGYTGSTWEADITAAKAMGIDGFVLNWIPPYCSGDNSWQESKLDDAYAVASLMGFKMMQSFDMSYAICDTFWTAEVMCNQIQKYAGYSSTYRWNSNILVSTFGGDTVPEYGNSFFQEVKTTCANMGSSISLAPALTSYSYVATYSTALATSTLMSDYPSIDGYMNWQAWPLNVALNATTTADQAFQSQLQSSGRTGPYIMAISPWQYKDLNTDDIETSWTQYADYLWPMRWQSVVGSSAFVPDMIEILSWNDYGESHYLRKLPSLTSGAADYVQCLDPTASNYASTGELGSYVNNMNHEAWQRIAAYYISWMKTGSAPTVTEDQVIVWYRTHPKSAYCWGGNTVPIRNAALPADAVFMWAAVTATSIVSATVGSNQYWTFEVSPGKPVVNMVPFPPEVYTGTAVTPQVAIMRNGATQQVNSGNQTISSSCSWQNYNAEVFLVGQS